MSRTYSTEGIILKSMSMGEADRLITVLSPDLGLIKLIAPGARKPKSRIGGRTALFVENQMMCLKGRSLDKLLQADVKHSFPGLSKNLAKLTTAQYWSELILCQSIEGTHDPKLYQLCIHLLTQLESCPSAKIHIALVEGISLLLHHAGVTPQIDHCSLSQEEILPVNVDSRAGVFFSFENGGVVLGECQKAVPKSTNKRLRETKTDYTGYVQGEKLSSSAYGNQSRPKQTYRLTLAQWFILNVITPESSFIPQSTDVYEDYGTYHWLTVEKILRGYAQHHFDKSIRSASLINSVFQL